MRLAHFKYGIQSLIDELEKDIPSLGVVSARYHRYFVQTLEKRLAQLERELASIRYVAVD